MADQQTSGISVSPLGSITSGLASYSGGSHHSAGSSSIDRSRQLTSLSLDEFIETDVEDYEENDYATLDEGLARATVQKSFLEQIWDGVKEVGATVVVGATSILSGVVDIAEAVVDGAAYVAAGALDLVGLDDAAKATREFIAQDLVGDANDWLYHNVGFFEWANENSAYAYDSPEMQGLRNLFKKAGEFVLATALTICTGGLATAGVGFLFGLGEAAEDSYQKYGTDLTVLQNALILLQGAGGALSWYSQGKLGKGLIEIKNAVSVLGLGDVLRQMKTEVFNKDFLRKLFSKGNVIGNTIASIFQSSGDITAIIGKIANGEEVTAEEWAKLAGELVLYFGLNTLEDAGRTYVTTFKISDDNAIKVAERLLDANDDFDIEKIVGLSPESRRKILDCMTPREIAQVLETSSKTTYKTIMSTLSKQDKLKVIYAQARLAAEGKYDAFFLNFREHAALHTDEVRDYAVALASRVDGVDLQEVYYGAQFHDLGMKGGFYRDADGICRPIDSIGEKEVTIAEVDKYMSKQAKKALGHDPSAEELDAFAKEKFGIDNWSSGKTMAAVPQEVQESVYLKRVKDYIEDNLPASEAAKYANATSIDEIPQDIIDSSYRYTLANLARSNHPLNSAMIILTEDVTPEGVDKNVVALLAMTHSKSTSGIKDFSNKGQWEACINRLEQAMLDAGHDPAEVERIANGLRETISDDATFKRLVDEALCIRDGDAMSMVPLFEDMDTIMQNGTHTHVSYTGTAKLPDDGSVAPVDPNLTGADYEKARKAAARAETDGIVDEIFDENGTPQGQIVNGFSKKTHAGELNVVFDSDYDGSAYIASAVIADPSATPMATLDSIFERTGEVATYGNCGVDRTFEIHLPKSLEGTTLGEWYKKEVAYRVSQEVANIGDPSKQNSQFYEQGIKVLFDLED